MKKINFSEVNKLLQGRENKILHRILPNGTQKGANYVALNPTRKDKNAGSFQTNTKTWQWCDFATGDKGGDIISLYAYLKGINQVKATRELLAMTWRV